MSSTTSTVASTVVTKEKKPFDKRKWRENKYSNKVKVDRWKENQEKTAKRKYFKMLRKDSGFGGKKDNPNLTPLGGDAPKARPQSFKNTKLEFERRQKKAEKMQKQEDRRTKYLEKQEAMKLYKKRKAEKFKVLCKKTKRGQPVMAGRMELLLEKIKQQTGSLGS